MTIKEFERFRILGRAKTIISKLHLCELDEN